MSPNRTTWAAAQFTTDQHRGFRPGFTMGVTMPAPSFNPIKHLRRASALRDNHIAERAKALAEALPASRVASMLGITRTEAEQIAARYGFTFTDQLQAEA